MVIQGELCAANDRCNAALLLAGSFEYGTTARILFDLADGKKYADGRTATWLCLLSAGGNVSVAAEVSRGLKYLDLNTCVVPISDTALKSHPGVPSKASGTECASACVSVFLGGRERLLHPQASIAVHQGRIPGGAACTFYNVRSIAEDLAGAIRRVVTGSPIALEAKIFWYGMLTSSDSLHLISGDPNHGFAGSNQVSSPVWRRLAARPQQ